MEWGSDRSSSHVHVRSCSTRPRTVKVQRSVSRWGVAPAVSTGHVSPVSYCPGGSRSSRDVWGRPTNPRVGGMAETLPAVPPGSGRRRGDRVGPAVEGGEVEPVVHVLGVRVAGHDVDLDRL